jgi:DNA-binding CsgD family transcriptional regulator
VEIDGEDEAAFSRAASLLALGCMARGDSPADYAVWVPAESAFIERIKQHANELLHTGRKFSCLVDLSPREAEVLKEILHHHVNKEIADHLSISVRTVKFHVSSLLAKFGVCSRWDLIQKAQPMFKNQQLADSFASLQPADSSPQAPAAQSVSVQACRGRKQQSHCVVPFRGGLRPA